MISKRSLAAAAVAAASLASAAPAGAAVPDLWARWAMADPVQREAHIRSLDFTAPGIVYAGSEDQGVFSSFNAGLTFSADSAGLEAPGAKNVRQIVSSGGQLYAGTGVGLFTKSAAGGSWQPLGQEPGPNKLHAAVQTINLNGPVITVGVASGGVLQSTDGGSTWTRSTGFPAAESVWWIEPVPLIPNTMYAAAGSGVYMTVDGGASWTLMSDGLPATSVLRVSLAVDFAVSGRAYAATSGGLYKTLNGGLTWTDASGSGASALGNSKIKAILVAPKFFKGPGRVIVGTENGVWATRDDGETWGQMAKPALGGDPWMGADLQAGQSGRVVWALGTNPVAAPGRFFAGTQGFGIYQLLFQPVVAKSGAGPVITSAPAPLRVNHAVTSSTGTWEGMAPHFLSLMWMRCNAMADTTACTETGDEKPTHVVTAADKDKYLKLRVTAKGLVDPQPDPVYGQATSKVMDVLGPAPVPPGSPYPRIVGQDGQSAGSKSYEWGETLTAQTGTWSANTTSFKYQWIRCDAGGANCVAIPGATAATYKTTTADAERKLQVEVIGKTADNQTLVTSGATFTLIERAPVPIDAPKIAGEFYAGETLSSSAGGWSGNKISYSRSWMVCDDDGTGCNTYGNGTTFKLLGTHRGKTVKLRIVASNRPGTGDDKEAFSLLSPVVTDRPVVVDPPAGGGTDPGAGGGGGTGGGGETGGTGGGTGGGGTGGGGTGPVEIKPIIKPLSAIVLPKAIKPGATLKVPKTIAGGTKLRFQWLRNGKPIKRATKASYRIAKGDRGKKVACRITYKASKAKKTFTTAPVAVPKK